MKLLQNMQNRREICQLWTLLTQDDVVEKNVAMLFNRAHRRPYLLEKKRRLRLSVSLE